MRIISYEVHSSGGDELEFSKINFSKLNLIVGDSGTGKTRLLNTLFNGACMAVRKEKMYIGWWEYIFEHLNHKYKWTIKTGIEDGEPVKVLEETILLLNKDGKNETLVQRDLKSFTFMEKGLPLLSSDQSSIFLLREDPVIKPLHSGFSAMMRRSFAGTSLMEASAYEPVPQYLLKKVNKNLNLDDVYYINSSLNVKLFILAKYFEPVFEKICSEFRNIFPFVTELTIGSSDQFGLEFPGFIPVFAMKEKFIKKTLIPLGNFSSGMIKVLLILTDIFLMPKDGGIYLIDEYENSLGVNAINFFPSILLDTDTEIQFIITSHHPYIIGNVPVKDWIVLHRKGTKVTAKQGIELEERFGKSKQQAFIQLINDPFYKEGVE